jgi:integrase
VGRPLDPKIQTVQRRDGSTRYRVRIRTRGKQTTETFASRAAARTFIENVKEFGADEAVAMRDRADPASAAYVPTLAEMLDRHVTELTGVDKRTKDDYRAVARRSWLPTLGRYPVDALTRAHVAKWVNSEDGKVKPKTIKNAHSVLSAVLETCVRDGLVSLNVARGTRLPRTGEETVEEIRYLTRGEFDRLLAATPAYWQPFMALLFGTGLRFSEATALQVRDVGSGTVRVMRAWKREAGEGIRLGPPKSKMSRRTIPVDPDVIATLSLDRPGSDWLFTTTTGRVVLHSNFYNRVWKPACIAAGLDPRPRIHDARHTYASWLIAKGVRLEVVQELLGHEDYTTTRRVYAHLMPEMKAEAALAASSIFAGSLQQSLRQIEA